jgi:hypothetical protein
MIKALALCDLVQLFLDGSEAMWPSAVGCAAFCMASNF